jgi:hypothetical protein
MNRGSLEGLHVGVPVTVAGLAGLELAHRINRAVGAFENRRIIGGEHRFGDRLPWAFDRIRPGETGLPHRDAEMIDEETVSGFHHLRVMDRLCRPGVFRRMKHHLLEAVGSEEGLRGRADDMTVKPAVHFRGCGPARGEQVPGVPHFDHRGIPKVPPVHPEDRCFRYGAEGGAQGTSLRMGDGHAGRQWWRRGDEGRSRKNGRQTNAG